LNALDFGLPQKRERIIIVGFRENIDFSFPTPLGHYQLLSQVLEPDDEIDPSYFAAEKIVSNRLAKIKKLSSIPSIWHENKGGNISALPYSCALRAGASYNYLLVNGKRRLTSREMLRLQGFPETFKIVVSYQAMRKLTGNSVAVPVIKAVADRMIDAIKQRQVKKAPNPYQQPAIPNSEMLWECGIGLPSPPAPLPSLGEGSKSRRIWRGEGCVGLRSQKKGL
jgi:DNA (cytosine-5)-methyltransferase 1